ncbi:hypothetical protein QBC44DRAFT_332388 [Cladorrhinum sp. PSN332]|nr:hypothetical protein QBC44DRAFT_332388 [Cladorrhinum sp. PSN332]
MNPDLIKETLLSPSSPSTSDSDDDKSEALLEKEADMAVYKNHQSRMQSNRRPPPLTLQTVQSQEEVTLQSDGVQQVQRIVPQPQQAHQLAEPVEKTRKPRGLKAFLLCCFRPDLSDDEEEEVKPKDPEYKMETYTYYPRQEPAMGRLGSFFRKSDDKRSDQGNDNPYAQQSPTDTYSPQAPSTSSFQSYNNNQYSQNQTGLPSGPRPGGYGRNDSNSAPPPYNQSASPNLSYSPYSPSDKKPSSSVGYGNDKFGAQSGYGSHRFDSDAASAHDNAYPPQRHGGYGGMGDDSLFSGYTPASNRDASPYAGQQQQFDDLRDEFGNRRELTEQEREDYEVAGTKNEIKQIQGQTEDSLDRILGQLNEADSRADDALDSLSRQGEVLRNVNSKIGEAGVQNRIALANVKDLEDANKSMFNFYAMSRKRRDQLNDERLVSEYQEKEERELSRQEAQQAKYRNAQRLQAGDQGQLTLGSTAGKRDNSRFTFEDSDGEQEEREQRIGQKEELALKGVMRIKQKMLAASDEIDEQNQYITRVAANADQVHDKVMYNQSRINRFK